MKKKLFIGVLLGVFSFTMLQAAPVNLGSAKKIAQEFCDWQSRAAKGDMLTCVYPAKAAKSGEFVPYYIFNVGNGNGFVIVSGDDNTMRNVLAYSEKGAFDMENLPDNVRYWLGYYEEQVKLASQMNVPARKKFDSHGTPIVAPLLGEVSYNQDAPYNLLCPIDKTTGKQCMVGCVATAIVSVAKYYEWPKQGRGIVEYTSKAPDGVSHVGGDIKEDLSKSIYDWDNILPTYEGTGVLHNGKQDTAIALLMRDAGYGASMGYSSKASGATINGAILSVVRHLSYDSLTSVRLRDSYDDDAEWISMLKVALDSAMPLYYTGVSEGGGHAFVCDGYDSMDYFHINWGWGSIGRERYDGFFQIQVLNPDGGGIGAGSGGYTQTQYVLYNMIPPTSANINTKARRLADDYRITANEVIRGGLSATDPVDEIKVRLTRLTNWTAANFYGKSALALYKDGEFVKIISDEEYLLLDGVLKRGGLVGQDKSLSFTARSQDLEEGDYDIWVVARSNREGAQWLKVHGSTPGLADKSYIAVRVVDGKFTLRSESCKVNITIVTSATKTIRYWAYDKFGTELDKGQTTNKRVNLDVLKGKDYTFKFYVLGYDTASLSVTAMQDTNVEVKLKQAMGLPHIYGVRVMDAANNVRFRWQKEGPRKPSVSPLGYILYLDSVFVDTAGVYTGQYGEYIFEKVPTGVHTFSVRSVFLDDTTDFVGETLNVQPVATETLSAPDCKIYPNPSTTGLFTLEVGQACRMQVSSVTGKILYEDKFDAAGQYTLPLQGYAAGMYIVRLFTDDKQSVLLKAFIR